MLPEEEDVGNNDSNIYNAMFNDREAFVAFFRNNRKQESWRDVMRAVVQTDKLRYWYCKFVNDEEELWSAIEDMDYCYEYCFWVKPRKELYSKITCDKLILKYLESIGKNILLSSRIKRDSTRYKACVAGYDYKATWSKITEKRWARAYVTNVRPRAELREYTEFTNDEWEKAVRKYKERCSEDSQINYRNGSRRTWKKGSSVDARVSYKMPRLY